MDWILLRSLVQLEHLAVLINGSITSNHQQIVMKKMLVALLPLLVLGKSEMMQKDQKKKS